MSELFLIHGWNMPNSIWSGMQMQWQQTSDTSVSFTTASLPGYAPSTFDTRLEHPQTVSVDEQPIESILSEHLDALLQQAPPSAHWCGWSLGATLAMAAALRFPERIARLTLISPTPRFLASDNWTWGMNQIHFEKLKRVIDRNPEKGWKRFFQLQLPRDIDTETSRRLVDQVGADFDRPNAIALELGKRILCEVDLRDQLKLIDIPTQVIAAQCDQIVPTEASRFVSQQIPNATFQPLKEGHGIPYLFPSELATLVANWEVAEHG